MEHVENDLVGGVDGGLSSPDIASDLADDKGDIEPIEDTEEQDPSVLEQDVNSALIAEAGLQHMQGQQVIIVASAEDGSITAATALPEDQEDNTDSLEPLPKRFRLEQAEDGSTFVLAVAERNQKEKRKRKNFIGEGNCDELPEGIVGDAQEEMKDDENNESAADATTSTASENIATTSTGTQVSDDIPDGKRDVSQAWFTTKDDKTALHNKGHSWKQGQWSPEETQLLQTNIANYCQEQNRDPTEVIFQMSKDERKDFYRTIARGLQRPLFSVYRRVIRMYDQRNHIGKYTPEELDRLKTLRETHGTDWATIGAALGRSASSVKDRCRLMKDTCNSGKWLPDEERRLTEAVYELTGVKPGENIVSGLSWANVAEKVKTRSEKQCRTKWLNYLNWKQTGGTEWTREDDNLLLTKIANSGATDETQIDWNELAKGWTSVRSPQWLRGKWWSMKRHIPDYLMLTFPEIIEYIRTLQTQNLSPTCLAKLKRSNTQNLVNRINPGLVDHTGAPIDLQRVSVIQNVNLASVLHVPVTAFPADGSAATEVVSGEEGEENGAFQAYEVLQSLNSSSQGAFLITQPQTNPPISFANMASDHIIVHTLPVNQFGDSMKGNENVAVQMNPQSPIIISAAPGQPGVATLHIPQPTAYALQSLEGVEQIGGELDQSDLSTDEHGQIINTKQDQIISTEDGFEDQAMDSTGIVGEVDQSELDATTEVTSDLVMVTSTSPQFVQTTGSEADLIHMSSLSDPMLPSDGTDLIGSSSDVEGEKVQTNEQEADSPDS